MWLLQPLLIHAGDDVAAVPLMAAKVVALGGSVVANFLLYRYVVLAGRAECVAGSERGECEVEVSRRVSDRSGRADEVADGSRKLGRRCRVRADRRCSSTDGPSSTDEVPARRTALDSRDAASALGAARRSRRSSGGSAKMSDSSALCTASASG